jgi:hypothetical protein
MNKPRTRRLSVRITDIEYNNLKASHKRMSELCRTNFLDKLQGATIVEENLLLHSNVKDNICSAEGQQE